MGEAAIPAHARLETYSVLTRMPPQQRVHGQLVADELGRIFPSERTLFPSAELARRIVDRCASAGISGGAVYDALVALTAAEAQLALLTLDVRAMETYRKLEIDFELLA